MKHEFCKQGCVPPFFCQCGLESKFSPQISLASQDRSIIEKSWSPLEH